MAQLIKSLLLKDDKGWKDFKSCKSCNITTFTTLKTFTSLIILSFCPHSTFKREFLFNKPLSNFV